MATEEAHTTRYVLEIHGYGKPAKTELEAAERIVRRLRLEFLDVRLLTEDGEHEYIYDDGAHSVDKREASWRSSDMSPPEHPDSPLDG